MRRHRQRAGLSIANGGGAVEIGSGSDCARNTITGPVSITNNTAGVSFVGNNVTCPLTITGNSGGFSYAANTINGRANVSGNS